MFFVFPLKFETRLLYFYIYSSTEKIKIIDINYSKFSFLLTRFATKEALNGIKAMLIANMLVVLSFVWFSCTAQEQKFERTFWSGANTILPCFNHTLTQNDAERSFISFGYKKSSNKDFSEYLRWRFRDGLFRYFEEDYEGKIQISRDGTLTILRATYADSGEYRCELKSFFLDHPEIWITKLVIKTTTTTTTATTTTTTTTTTITTTKTTTTTTTIPTTRTTKTTTTTMTTTTTTTTTTTATTAMTTTKTAAATKTTTTITEVTLTTTLTTTTTATKTTITTITTKITSAAATKTGKNESLKAQNKDPKNIIFIVMLSCAVVVIILYVLFSDVSMYFRSNRIYLQRNGTSNGSSIRDIFLSKKTHKPNTPHNATYEVLNAK